MEKHASWARRKCSPSIWHLDSLCSLSSICLLIKISGRSSADKMWRESKQEPPTQGMSSGYACKGEKRGLREDKCCLRLTDRWNHQTCGLRPDCNAGWYLHVFGSSIILLEASSSKEYCLKDQSSETPVHQLIRFQCQQKADFGPKFRDPVQTRPAEAKIKYKSAKKTHKVWETLNRT